MIEEKEKRVVECLYCKQQSDSEKWEAEILYNTAGTKRIEVVYCPKCSFMTPKQKFLPTKEKMKIEAEYICPNCQRDKFAINYDSLTGFTKGVVQIECECGLKTIFDWNKVKQFDIYLGTQ